MERVRNASSLSTELETLRVVPCRLSLTSPTGNLDAH